MTAPEPREGIMELRPYKGGDAVLEGFAEPIRLASNEGALGPSPLAVAALERLGPELHRYPDGGATAMRQALAEHHGLEAERIVCGTGSDELLSQICRAYAGPGDEVVYSEHGFMWYKMTARSCGATPVAAPEVDLTANVDNLLAAVGAKTRVVFLANPNNPTGTAISRHEIERLHAGLPEDVLLVLDGAYAEYIEDDWYSDGAELVEAAQNVVMTRTFSKLHSLAHIRLGWAYCPTAVADVLDRIRAPFNVAGPAIAAGLAALADREHAVRTRAHTIQWRDWLAAEASKLGLGTTSSVANFVLLRFPDTAGRTAHDADTFLRQRGIIVRTQDPVGLSDCLRISIGNEDEMRTTLAALSEFMQD
ncbi:MAG: histidinol-phosphate transaminase [Rhodospirillaceae bacterium]|nr:histidinol-phosphate transaminase [Rhodospirillaceae bacterium]